MVLSARRKKKRVVCGEEVEESPLPPVERTILKAGMYTAYVLVEKYYIP